VCFASVVGHVFASRVWCSLSIVCLACAHMSAMLLLCAYCSRFEVAIPTLPDTIDSSSYMTVG
jgi:hypothetical protein